MPIFMLRISDGSFFLQEADNAEQAKELIAEGETCPFDPREDRIVDVLQMKRNTFSSRWWYETNFMSEEDETVGLGTAIDLYAAYRVDLTRLPRVGVGSICRRQSDVRIALLLADLARGGLKLHGLGLTLAAPSLTSADSLAWSIDARRRPSTCPAGHTHQHCGNCYAYAAQWRERVIALLEAA